MGILGGLISDTVGALPGAAANWIGGDMAAKAQRKANSRARNDLSQGYGEAKGYQKPIYDTALGNYTDLSGKYAGGGFETKAPGTFQFDPNSVFQDPEYQAQMRAGTSAINTGAQGKGTLFSGANDRDLTQFASDLFANRSDALYNRGFNAQNMGFNQQLAANNQNFNQGFNLAQPLGQAAGNLSDLSTNLGESLAGNSLNAGNIRASNILGKADIIGGLGNKLGKNSQDYFLGKGA